MAYQDIIQQLEFFRDIGIETLSIPDAFPANEVPMAQVTTAPVAVPLAWGYRSAPEGGPDSNSTGDPGEAGRPPSVETLDAIRADIGDCQRCKLAPTRTHIVYGSGNPNAEIVFVGEAPGFEEDQQGLPFVGAAGQLLTKIIESTGVKRDDVYICNILKCRPPNNRNPEPDEVFSCSPFLKRQIAAIQPKIVCCLGKFAAQTMLRSSESITRLRGQFHDIDGMRIIATFHPAYLLRSPEKKREVWEDMKQIRAELFRLRF